MIAKTISGRQKVGASSIPFKSSPPVMRLVVINLVGLSRSLLGEHMPGLAKFAERNGLQSYTPAFPAVTCTAPTLSGGWTESFRYSYATDGVMR
jgi:predicted AlkP superfamily pyrophosphatase or phosphodiesterase